jgi:hypothetical protein
VIKTLFLDQDEESMHLRGPTSYPLLVTVPCDLPGHDQPEARAGLRRGLGGAPQAAAAAAEAAGGEGRKGPAGPLDRAQLLAALGGSHLTSYMGKVVPGWYQRPKVGGGAAAVWLRVAATGGGIRAVFMPLTGAESGWGMWAVRQFAALRQAHASVRSSFICTVCAMLLPSCAHRHVQQRVIKLCY